MDRINQIWREMLPIKQDPKPIKKPYSVAYKNDGSVLSWLPGECSFKDFENVDLDFIQVIMKNGKNKIIEKC